MVGFQMPLVCLIFNLILNKPMGFDGYLAKPINKEELEKTLFRLL